MRWKYSFRPHNVPTFAEYGSIDELLGGIRLWLLRVEGGEIPAVAAYLLPQIELQGDEAYPDSLVNLPSVLLSDERRES